RLAAERRPAGLLRLGRLAQPAEGVDVHVARHGPGAVESAAGVRARRQHGAPAHRRGPHARRGRAARRGGGAGNVPAEAPHLTRPFPPPPRPGSPAPPAAPSTRPVSPATPCPPPP